MKTDAVLNIFISKMSPCGDILKAVSLNFGENIEKFTLYHYTVRHPLPVGETLAPPSEKFGERSLCVV